MNNPLSLTDPSGYAWWNSIWTRRLIRSATLGAAVGGDWAGAAFNRQYAYQFTQNPDARMVGATVAAHFAFYYAAPYGGAQYSAGAGAVGGAAAGFAAGGIQGGSLRTAVYGAFTGAITGGVFAGIGEVLGNSPASQANDWDALDGETGGGPSTPAGVKKPPIYPTALTTVAGTRALGHFPVESPFSWSDLGLVAEIGVNFVPVGGAIKLVRMGWMMRAGASEVKLASEQLKNIERFEKKLPANARDSLNVRSLPNEGVAAQATSPGRVPVSRSSAVYEKQIDAVGTTTQYTKTTYDPAGNIVHVKDKLNGGVFP